MNKETPPNKLNALMQLLTQLFIHLQHGKCGDTEEQKWAGGQCWLSQINGLIKKNKQTKHNSSARGVSFMSLRRLSSLRTPPLGVWFGGLFFFFFSTLLLYVLQSSRLPLYSSSALPRCDGPRPVLEPRNWEGQCPDSGTQLMLLLLVEINV